MKDNSPSMLKATAIGGAVAGLLGALPGLSLINCACCALVMAGGFFAAFLYSRDCARVGAEFRPGNGALVGLIAAAFYSLATNLTSAVLFAARGASIREVFEEGLAEWQETGQEIPPEAEQFVESLIALGPVLLIVMGFFFWLLLAAVFSTIGGLIGGAVFKVEPQPPVAPPSAMPPPGTPPSMPPPPQSGPGGAPPGSTG